ncbi:hypothetical protein C8R45DRAFT_780746, partial [Mycena sanguinolenta]
KSPPITSFQLPPGSLLVAIFLFTVVPYGAFAPSPTTGGPLSSLLVPAQFLRSYVNQKWFGYLWWTTIGLHGAQTLYTLSVCVRNKVPFMVSVKYCIATFFIGFPVWIDLLRRIDGAK